MNSVRIMVFAALLAAAATPALAQQGPPAGPAGGQENEEIFAGPGRGGPPSEEKREEIRKKIEAIRVWRLTETLKLDQKTAAAFVPVTSSLEQQRHDRMRENREIVRELQALLDAKSIDEKGLKAALERVRKNQREMMRLREKELDAAREYLSVEQQARYIIFQHTFQREMRGMISGAQGPGRGMRGMRGEPGRGGPPSGPGMP